MKRAFRIMTAVLAAHLATPAQAQPADRIDINLSGDGWKLWLDRAAPWQHDELFLPPVDIAKLPAHPPTGGWDALRSGAKDVHVPGTVEEYLHPGNGPQGDITGVSWWTRTVKIPEAHTPRQLLLHFDSVRQRAEVFVNRQLAGYDVIGNTPFDADITSLAKPGENCEIAIRITDPGGNFDWRDSSTIEWGDYAIPVSHGFGGVTGAVHLVSRDPVAVDDIYVQNTPAITGVNVIATVKNQTAETTRRDVVVTVSAKTADGDPVNPLPAEFETVIKDVKLEPGDNTVTSHVSLPAAKPWSPETPNLYLCQVSLRTAAGTTDSDRRRFGFRWFAPDVAGDDAMFRLNRKRIVLRTAISWGFWPVNGIYPTPTQAAADIRTAKALGQNMLNFHRCIGRPEVFDKADELGLLIYEEPGAYVTGDTSPFTKAMAREKLLRMVRRDRSRPSLIIYNMINEGWDSHGAGKDPKVLDGHFRDLRDAHALDPSRAIIHTSAWAKKDDADEPQKAHMLPFDNTFHLHGWFDNHHAGGPAVWNQGFYKDPDHYYNRTNNRKEIVYWGEEGALSSPSRLALIKDALESSPQKGWDGQAYLDMYRQFDDFLSRKDLRRSFTSVDALTSSMGAVSLEHQGRKIQLARINDATDGYAVNGWESELVENHSGIVDCFRNPKADPSIMAQYNQPFYVAVMPRDQFVQIPGEVTVDFHIVNEIDRHGPHTLRITAYNPARSKTFEAEVPVQLRGGDVFGELLKQGVKVPISDATGMFRVQASLVDSQGREVATGRDDILAVDWKNQPVAGKGATWEGAPHVGKFLRSQKSISTDTYADNLGKLDWVVVTRPPREGIASPIPPEQLYVSAGGAKGLQTSFFGDSRFKTTLFQRVDPSVDFTVPDGATPNQAMGASTSYGMRWEGMVVPMESGDHTFTIESTDGVRMWIGDRLLFDDLKDNREAVRRGHADLTAGRAVSMRVELWHRKGNLRCKLLWSQPEKACPDADKLMQRVRDDGTTLVLLDRADTWADLLAKYTSARCTGSFAIGTNWLGGLHFVRSHPLFQDLPADMAMGWPYQSVVRNGKSRSGLLLEGEELVAGAWHSYPMALGTAVGVIPCGKGHIIISTLGIADQLQSPDSDAHVARKLLCNFISYHPTPP